jgi:hypothetical protein
MLVSNPKQQRFTWYNQNDKDNIKADLRSRLAKLGRFQLAHGMNQWENLVEFLLNKRRGLQEIPVFKTSYEND